MPSPPQTSTIFVHDLCRVDCALFDPTLGIHGQSWHVDLKVSGDLDDKGFVHDFSPLKRFVRDTLKETVDHALLIPISSKYVEYQESQDGDSWLLHSKSKMAQFPFEWRYNCQKGAVYPIRAVALKRSIIQQELERVLRHRLPEPIHNISINLREESIGATEASFRYTHGLPKHDGLCQRLFHGHRSRLEVYVSDERRPDLEHYITWDIFGRDVHIASPDQLVDAVIEPGSKGKGHTPVKLRYEGTQGYFEGALPAERIFVVAGETSVECIAHQLAKLVAATEKTNEPVKVVCYEGIGKGAIAEI